MGRAKCGRKVVGRKTIEEQMHKLELKESADGLAIFDGVTHVLTCTEKG